jgi:GNAT superfamily N-acetyltransferase
MAPAVYSRKRQRALERSTLANSAVPPCDKDSTTPWNDADEEASSPHCPLQEHAAVDLRDARPHPRVDGEVPRASTSPQPRKRRWVQLHLDAGQRDLSHRTCAVCDMVYAPGAPGDNALHRRVHARAVAARRRPPQLDCPKVSVGRVVATPPGARVIAVRPGDDGRAKRWIQRVDAYVARQIGELAPGTADSLDKSHWLAMLYVSKEHRSVDGYAFFEQASNVRRATVSSDGMCLTKTPFQATGKTLCGVRRVWVAPACRRGGIATMLLNLARTYFHADGRVIPQNMFAFTAPTQVGAFLALNFVHKNSGNVLTIYNPPAFFSSPQDGN